MKYQEKIRQNISYEPRFKAKSAKTQKNPQAINCLYEATQAKTDKDILRKLFGETLFFQIVQLNWYIRLFLKITSLFEGFLKSLGHSSEKRVNRRDEIPTQFPKWNLHSQQSRVKTMAS